MKQYDRESKRWVEEEELTKKLAKRKNCKGGRPHQWLLQLPWGYDALKDLQEREIEYIYESENRIADFLEQEKKIAESIGVKKHSWIYRPERHYRCGVCGKKK